MLSKFIGPEKSSEQKSLLTQKKLEAFLWKSADILRGSIDSSEYKHYIFGLLFLKRLSDQFEEEQMKIDDDPEDPDNYRFFVPPHARWKYIRKFAEGIGNKIDKAFEMLEEANPSKLENVLTPIQFEDPRKLTDATLQKLLRHFSQKEYHLADSNLSEPDILGRAYEYLIKQFADDSGKKGGEFYTPQGVVQLLVRILQPEEGMRICDPACGSGGMLIECRNYLKEQGQNYENLMLFGEEKNLNTWSIAKMNLLLHNVFDSQIKRGDTMLEPILEDGHLMLFDMVIANPMWNQKEWHREMFEKGDTHGRVKYGIPPKSSGDWMWIQHMLATLNENGRMGVVLDNGALFRGGAEGKIRRKMIEADFIEGIIALPANLFYNTSSPGCLIIINKNKKPEFKNNIFFIHAENEYEEGKAQNFLKWIHINRITDVFRVREIRQKFSALIELKEIKENDYNLNVSRYIDIIPDDELIDLNSIIENIEDIRVERIEQEREFERNIKDIGL